MPERGWSVLTVREDTARRIKEMAKTKGWTVDEMIGHLIINPKGKEGSATCEACSVKVKTSNINEHMNKVHPKLTVKA
ncbi:MAG: hypothetical protein M1503_12670 [Thaumarchaeota archaeon]|nr:hypothetical protein [Nitrososphaerota archaeon]MCL5319093.1 hypothetical protein [Nitrososphaerota archaeon]